ncbi:MAG: hypothetical protein K2X66_17415, partial [Cyanobacteria bacterium]|nr:hypothetical protein [Cyanobacteriota bacterium]
MFVSTASAVAAFPSEKSMTTSSENSILEEIQGIKWQSPESTAQPVQWLDLIGHVKKNDSEIQMSREKITETEAKREDVEMKRVLFFFKYFDSGFLEGSAESDVVAVSAHAQGVLQATLLECAHKYYGLVRSILMQYIAFQSIEEGKAQLKLNQQRFTMGQSTHFEVLETESNLIHDYQDYLQAGIGYRVASFAMAEKMNFKKTGPQELFFLYPVELTITNVFGCKDTVENYVTVN